MKIYKCDICGEDKIKDTEYCLPLWMPQITHSGIVEKSAICNVQVNMCEKCRVKIANLLYENKISTEGRLKDAKCQ